ncbi:signal peptidase II [Metamycoplasma buccale]|uniref:signal peptidase II n=1 Tax=Metamycoplasma buccale TaxID=55602 RepID=UPI00398F27F0
MDKKRKVPKFFTKEFWKTYSWKNVLINLGIYLSIFVVTLIIDLVTKGQLFHWVNKDGKNIGDGKTIYENFLFGFRSVLHAGTTIEIGLTIPGLHVISIIILLVSIAVSGLLKDKIYRYVIPGFALIASGATGNMVDRFLFKAVRDIVYLPWLDTGTFNFADVWLVFGGIYTLISMLTVILISNKKDKNKPEEHSNEVISSVDFESNNSTITVDPNQNSL